MSTQKKNVLVLCGGYSPEYEISVRSAKMVYENMDRALYEPYFLYLDRSGKFYHIEDQQVPKFKADLATSEYKECVCEIQNSSKVCIVNKSMHKEYEIDVVFPVMHGPFCEDGSIQGYFDIMKLPYVGSDVISSAIAMDKEMTKLICEKYSIEHGPYLVFDKEDELEYKEVVSKLGCAVLFIKPAIMGSSIGISKVLDNKQFRVALDLAYRYSKKVMIEAAVDCREIECAILEHNGKIIASVPGEIRPTHEFYSYEAKYLDDNGAELIVPAALTEQVVAKVQANAKKLFRKMGCKGLARIDFFVTKDERVLLNEINPIPGFTSISMYPRMMEFSGVGKTELITKLLQNAFEANNRHEIYKVA